MTTVYVAATPSIGTRTFPVEAQHEDIVFGSYLATMVTYEPRIDKPSKADLDQESGFIFPD